MIQKLLNEMCTERVNKKRIEVLYKAWKTTSQILSKLKKKC